MYSSLDNLLCNPSLAGILNFFSGWQSGLALNFHKGHTVAGPLRVFTGFPIYFLPVPRASQGDLGSPKGLQSPPDLPLRQEPFRESSPFPQVGPRASGTSRVLKKFRVLEILDCLHHLVCRNAKLLHDNVAWRTESETVNANHMPGCSNVFPPEVGDPRLDGDPLLTGFRKY